MTSYLETADHSCRSDIATAEELCFESCQFLIPCGLSLFYSNILKRLNEQLHAALIRQYERRLLVHMDNQALQLYFSFLIKLMYSAYTTKNSVLSMRFIHLYQRFIRYISGKLRPELEVVQTQHLCNFISHPIVFSIGLVAFSKDATALDEFFIENVLVNIHFISEDNK
jgi:hypothetical protein